MTGRKIVQITAAPEGRNYTGAVWALCDDGTLWGRSYNEDKWVREDPIPDAANPGPVDVAIIKAFIEPWKEFTDAQLVERGVLDRKFLDAILAARQLIRERESS